MNKGLAVILIVFFSSVGLYAQLSPGDLAKEHEQLEGIKNCTQCHDLGSSVSSVKCLDCHVEIQLLLDMDRGYHASEEVREKECFDCHSDHHGKDFDMKRIDKETFEHELTGFKLEGQHASIDCRACHQPDLISARELKDRDSTFLGLSIECKDCHVDFHQGTVTNNQDCASCHDEEAFRPAPGFDHNNTQFPLLGSHKEVDCIECHTMGLRNGLEFQTFTNIRFEDCVSCHQDPHMERLPGMCSSCHVEEGFQVIKGRRGFDHSLTDFDLTGAHKTVSCFDCHTTSSDPMVVFSDHEGTQQNDCLACHEDLHTGQFGTNCLECHTTKDWFVAKLEESFNHNRTRFPLLGLHQTVSCKDCHIGDTYTVSLAFDDCFDCHEDYHQGDFVSEEGQRDCDECHQVTLPFTQSTFGINEHQLSVFPLEGSHIATPCFACHLDEAESWTFREVGTLCIDCHDDRHGGQFVENGRTDCSKCHQTEDWRPILFDHDKTAFPLDGKHALAECTACHKNKEGLDYMFYSIERFECIDCHSQ